MEAFDVKALEHFTLSTHFSFLVAAAAAPQFPRASSTDVMNDCNPSVPNEREPGAHSAHIIRANNIYIAIACSVIFIQAYISTITATCVRAHGTALRKLQ